jgi:hypothetical protein
MDCLNHCGLCKDFIEMSMFYVLQDDCVYIYNYIYIIERESNRYSVTRICHCQTGLPSGRQFRIPM